MDWNNDGHLDILSGCYWSPDADAAHIEVLAGRGDMDFAAAEPLLNVSGKPHVNVRSVADPTSEEADDSQPDSTELRNICTQQHAADVDGDGDLDLIVGCFGTSFFLVQNSGSPDQPALSDNPQELSVKSPSHHSAPHLVDWDGDGDLDLLSGSAVGGVYLSENIGTLSHPEWAPFQQLIAPTGKSNQTDDDPAVLVPSSSTRIWVVDWNGDGLLDVLMGDMVVIKKRKPGIMDQEYQRLKAEHQKELKIVQSEYAAISERYAQAQQAGAEVDEILQREMESMGKRFSEVWQANSKFEDEQRTGFVWLYLQKASE